MIAASIQQWHAALAPRDQQVLRYGAIAVAVILVGWALLAAQSSLGAARDHLQQQQADLERMRQIGPTLAAAGPGPMPATGQQSVVALIDTSANESGLGKAITGNVLSPQGGMSVRMENADFNLLVGWLHRLSSQHGLKIEGASINVTGAPGMVNASIQLRAATAPK